MTDQTFKIIVERIEGMQFKATFDKEQFPEIMFDEPPNVPGGKDQYPNASRYLASAVANCLSASLTFCLEKSRVPVEGLRTEITGTISRNEQGYWRVKKFDVDIKVRFKEVTDEVKKKFERCKNIFFNYCVVSASIKEGIEINVSPSIEE